MTVARFGTLVGIAIGAIWVFTGALLVAVLAAVGFVMVSWSKDAST